MLLNKKEEEEEELGYLFLDKSSLHIVARDLDVERSQLWFIVLDDVKSYNTIKDLLTIIYIYAHYSKGASVK